MCVLREMIKFLFTIYLSQNCYVNYFFLDEKVTKNQGPIIIGPIIIGLHRLGPIAIGLKMTLHFVTQKKLASLKQFFVLNTSFHLFFSVCSLRSVLSIQIIFNN